MTGQLVLDASVVVKWFLPEQGADAALRLLRRIRQGEFVAAAPELLSVEVGNTLWKRITRGQLAPEDALKILAALRASPLQIHSLSPVLTSALEIAVTTRCTVYDASYIALALQLDGALVTADAKLKAQLQGSAYAARVQLI